MGEERIAYDGTGTPSRTMRTVVDSTGGTYNFDIQIQPVLATAMASGSAAVRSLQEIQVDLERERGWTDAVMDEMEKGTKKMALGIFKGEAPKFE